MSELNKILRFKRIPIKSKFLIKSLLYTPLFLSTIDIFSHHIFFFFFPWHNSFPHLYRNEKLLFQPRTQWLVSVLSASCVSAVSLLWKLAAVLLWWEQRKGRGSSRGPPCLPPFTALGVNTSHSTSRPLRTFITQAPKQRLQTSRARMGPLFF